MGSFTGLGERSDTTQFRRTEELSRARASEKGDETAQCGQFKGVTHLGHRVRLLIPAWVFTHYR